MATRSKAEIAAQIAALQAQLDPQDGGVHEDPQTGSSSSARPGARRRPRAGAHRTAANS